MGFAGSRIKNSEHALLKRDLIFFQSQWLLDYHDRNKPQHHLLKEAILLQLIQSRCRNCHPEDRYDQCFFQKAHHRKSQTDLTQKKRNTSGTMSRGKKNLQLRSPEFNVLTRHQKSSWLRRRVQSNLVHFTHLF